MPLSVAEKDHLVRLVAWARIAFALLAFVAAGESRSAGGFTGIFLLVYVLAALLFALVAQYWPRLRIRVPVWIDVIAMAVFLPFTASYVSFLMLFCFSAFAVATSASAEVIRGFVGLSVMAAAARLGLHNTWNRGSLIDFGVLMAGTAAAGAGAAWLGRRERQETDRRYLLEKISGEIQFERGLSESIQHGLSDLAQAFDCEQGCLAYLDDELERIFVWRVRPGEIAASGPETLSLSRVDSYLLDSLEVTTCWNSLEAHGEAFGWDRRTGQPVANPPRPPASMKDDLGVKSLLAATLQEADGRPTGRVLVFNRRHKFSRSDLRWFEHIVRHISPQIDNVYRMRHLRARAVEAERSRISRDLHDGILQTLLSLQIQLEVMRRNASNGGAHISSDLGTLQKTVRHEADELRRMVTEMRPLRVESADLRELMMGFAERFQNESNLAVDLFVDDKNLRAPDRVCREIFQIYRESLNNIKKHAHASHVVVKLNQDESKLNFVIDDNGLGFSFSGRFSSEELDRLRLGPISIKERTRSVGGNLTVESNPGHGARLTIEIPLN
jgi:signal transduction histidine kinase